MPDQPSTAHAVGSSQRRLGVRVLLMLAGVALAVAFVTRVGAGEVAHQLRHAGPKALWLFLPYAAGTALGAVPWVFLLQPGDRPSPAGVLVGRFVASSANALLPFFGMAGEPARLLWLREEARARGLAGIVVDRILYNAANGAFLLAGAVVAWLATSLPVPLALGACVIAVLTIGVTAAGFWIVGRGAVGTRLHRLLHKFLGDAYAAAGFGTRVDSALIELVRGPRAPLLRGVTVHFAGKLVLALEVYVGMWALGSPVSVASGLVLAVVPIALSFLFSTVPGQLGVQEGAQTLVAGVLQLDPATVLSLVLLQRARQLAFAGVMPVLLACSSPRAARDV